MSRKPDAVHKRDTIKKLLASLPGCKRSMRSVAPALLALAALLTWSACAEQDAPEVSESNTVEATPEASTPVETPAAETPPEATDAAATPAEETPSAEGAPDEAAAAPPAKRWYRGSFETEIDSIIARDDTDLDVSQYLRLDVDPPKYPRLHLRASLWTHQDLSSDSGKPNTLRDINDASSSDVQARLLYLYADIDNVFGDQSVLRIGRHRIQEGAAYNRIDGIYARRRAGAFEFYGFLGARASVYRDTSDDLVLGGGAAWLPGTHTRIALDGYYAEESRYGVAHSSYGFFNNGFRRPIAPEINDSRVTLSLWHSFGANTRAFARLGMLGSNVDELTLSLNGYIPRLDVLYDVDYRQLFDTTGDTTADLSPFYRILGQYRQHQTLYVGLHRPLSQKVTVSLEGEIRNADNDEFYSSNRDYIRVGTVLNIDKAFKNFDLTTAVEYWDVSNGEGTWSLTGEISRSWEKVEWRAGVDFVRYKDRVIEYDRRAALVDSALVAFVPGIYPGFSFLAREYSTRVVDTRENVYSLFTDVEWEFRKDQEVFAKFSFEEDDGPDSPYWRLRAGYRIQF